MNTSGNIIGFATQYYTLWSFRTETHYVMDVHGKHRPSYIDTQYTFHKNISKSIDAVTHLYPNVSIDEGLRGKTRSFSVKSEKDLTPELLKFGKWNGYTISEVAETDFDYILWLRGNARYELSQLIEELPQVIQYELKKEAKRVEKIQKIRSSFLTEGEYTITFDRNLSSECLSELDWKISFDETCPKMIIDRLYELEELKVNWAKSDRVEPLMTQTLCIDDVNYLMVFPHYKQVDSMYPYKMGWVNGKFMRVKGKEITTKLTPIGFSYYEDITNPIQQIIMVG